MSLPTITDANAVRNAMAEYDQVGRDVFLQRYGFGRARQYFVKGDDGKLYDSKAIVGAAHGFQCPEQGPLRAADFSGGEQTVKVLLEQLGFSVIEADKAEVEPILVNASHATGGVPRIWVEKTIVRDREDRKSGENRLGEALWSPQKSADGRDVYANMRDVRAGDVILHLVDNEAFAGVSRAAAPADVTFRG
jgi:putative restriction endonuclease